MYGERVPELVTVNGAVKSFLKLGGALQQRLPLTGAAVLDELGRWYGDVRLNDAGRSDRLTVQWEISLPRVLAGPTDLRRQWFDRARFEPGWHNSLSIIRTVRSRAWFRDYDHVAMWCMVVFDPTKLSEKREFFSIDSPAELAHELEAARKAPYLSRLLATPSMRIVVSADPSM